MSPIDLVPPEYFFAELLLPFKRSSARKGIHFLALKPTGDSLWGPVVTRTGGIERLSAGSAGGAEMLDRLRQYWVARRETNLPKLVPYLEALRQNLLAVPAAASDPGPAVSEFVYPLF